MKEKEYVTFIWIHHIATLIGLCSAISNVKAAKQSWLRRIELFLFLASQFWAVLKIITELITGRSRLRESFQRIHMYSKNIDQERGMIWCFMFLAVVWKIMMPGILRKK